MPINTNLTNVPPKSLLLPFGAKMTMKTVNPTIIFDDSGNIALTFTVGDGQWSFKGPGGEVMPPETIAISKIPNANVVPKFPTMTFTVAGAGVLGVNLYFEIDNSDVGKQKNPNLQFSTKKTQGKTPGKGKVSRR